MAYKVVMDGFDDDETFDTEQEAQEYGETLISNYRTGGEVLNLSNPGDYPLEGDDDPEYEVVEIED